ncbi:MAG: phosphate ABC transporter permease subunit PstC [Candidatus Nanopelagicales bacterium]|jgi:phosphate transport system permease protein|nr:phosphate ABC transporter permease subunit PstC [Candidatus Nanopelagicales bacterium]HRY10987.1 phosphate ABC transporter permease subunit PstC [Candidatus Nanopelagicales bacterium]
MSPDLKPLDAPSGVQGSKVRLGDRIFSNLTRGAGIFVLLIMASIGAFLVWKAVPAFQNNTGDFFTTQQWFPDADPPIFGIAALAFGTAISSVIAMLIAVPIAIGTALFIAFFSSRKASTSLGFVIDVLAAVPSIIYGLWGLQVLMNHMDGITKWLNDYLGFIPLFNNEIGIYTKSIFIASVVLAIMILPTISALSREVFLQVPRDHREASLALGATRWEMIRMAVLPFSRPGIISATMLGLGRALGETIAVALILSAAFEINWHITEPGGNTFAANIALKWNEAGPIGLSALIASGLILFIITLVVNMIARAIIAKHKEFSGANS